MPQFNRIVLLSVVIFVARLCSADFDVGFRIIGGRATTIFQVSYMVSITYHSDHICGAVIVKPKIVLSAAHCFPRAETHPRSIALYYEAQAGKTHLADRSYQSIRLKSVLKHPRFNVTNFDNDISISFLIASFEYGLKIQPIALPPTADAPLPIGDQALITGWGATKYLGYNSDELQSVSITIHNQTLCKAIYKQHLTPNMFCAGNYLAVQDACMGDSGGPLVWSGVLIGIVSWGKDCGVIGYPGVYTNVAKMMPWLREFISV